MASPSSSATHGTSFFSIGVNVSLSPGIPQAVIATPAVGVLLRLGVACALALPASDVLISSVATLGAAQLSALDPSLPVNTQGGSCSLVNARRMEMQAAALLGPAALAGARVLGDASCSVSASSPLVTAVGVAVLVDGTRSAADSLAASLGAMFGSPQTRNATFRAFLDAAANASGVPTGCFSTAALQSAPAVSIADTSLRPGAGGSNQGPPSSSGGASGTVIGGAIAGAVAALCCCAVLAVLVALRFRRQKSPVRVAGKGDASADKGVASPGGSLRYLVLSNPLRDAAAAPKPAVEAGSSSRVPDASGATTPKRSPAPPLRKERSIWRLTAPFMAHTAAAAALPSARVHVPPPRVLAADLESPPHADAEQQRTVVTNPLHAREAVGGAASSATAAAAASGEGDRGGAPAHVPRLLSSALSEAEGSSSGSSGSRARGPSDPLAVSNNPLHAGGPSRTGTARASMVPPALRGVLLPGRSGDNAPGADVKRHEGGFHDVVVSGVNPLHRHGDAAAAAAPATTVTRRVLRHVDADVGGGSGDAADAAPGTPADNPLWPHRSTAAARRVLLPQFERELQREEVGAPLTPDPETLDATVVGSTPGTGFRSTNPLRQGRVSMAPVAAGGLSAETATAARMRSTALAAQPLLAPMTTRRPGARNLNAAPKVAAAAAPPGAEADAPPVATTETLISVRARGTSRHAEVV